MTMYSAPSLYAWRWRKKHKLLLHFSGLSALPLPAGAGKDFLVPSFYAYDQSAWGSESWWHLHFWLSPVFSSSGPLEEPVAQWVSQRRMWPGSGRGSRGWRVPAALGYWGSVAIPSVETNPLPPLCFFALCFLTCIQSITPLYSHFFLSNESNAEKSLNGISHSKGSSNLSLFSPLTFFSPTTEGKHALKVRERKKSSQVISSWEVEQLRPRIKMYTQQYGPFLQIN